MEISVRKAGIKDLKSIQELNLLLFNKEYDEYDKLLNLKWTFGTKGTEYFKKRLRNGCVLVASMGGEIIGYICGGISTAEEYRNLPKLAELENMFVLEQHRSKGVGKILYNNFLKWCKKQKVKKLRVQASAPNLRAIKFYRDNQFKDYTLILENDI